MRNLLAFLAALVLTLAGVGLYLDWFKIRTSTPSSGQRTVNIDVNTEKVGEDLQDGADYLIRKGSEKIRETTEDPPKRDQPRAETHPKQPTNQ